MKYAVIKGGSDISKNELNELKKISDRYGYYVDDDTFIEDISIKMTEKIFKEFSEKYPEKEYIVFHADEDELIFTWYLFRNGEYKKEVQAIRIPEFLKK